MRLLADFKVAVVEQVIQRKGCKEKNSMEDVASEFASRMADLVSACNIMPSDGDEEKETEPHVDGQVDGCIGRSNNHLTKEPGTMWVGSTKRLESS